MLCLFTLHYVLPTCDFSFLSFRSMVRCELAYKIKHHFQHCINQMSKCSSNPVVANRLQSETPNECLCPYNKCLGSWFVLSLPGKLPNVSLTLFFSRFLTLLRFISILVVLCRHTNTEQLEKRPSHLPTRQCVNERVESRV